MRPHRKPRYWVIPPSEDAAFVAAMERVLKVYQRPEVTAFPVVAMDERPVELAFRRQPTLGKDWTQTATKKRLTHQTLNLNLHNFSHRTPILPPIVLLTTCC